MTVHSPIAKFPEVDHADARISQIRQALDALTGATQMPFQVRS
jgi:hypothetical protein